MPHRRLTAPVAIFALTALLLSGVALVASAAGNAAPTRPAAKVKCVSVSTGFARYSRSGTCSRGERRDPKPCARGGTCVVGDAGPAGGRVFYAARTKQPWGRYLEVAPRPWNPANPDALLTWCSDVSTSLAGTQATGLGAGRANTAAMVAACGPNTAATVAAAYRGGGRSDWYLPSKDELRALFVKQRLSLPFELRGYWSSSEASASEAWIQDFYASGNYPPAPSDKQLFNCVRPIRAF